MRRNDRLSRAVSSLKRREQLDENSETVGLRFSKRVKHTTTSSCSSRSTTTNQEEYSLLDRKSTSLECDLNVPPTPPTTVSNFPSTKYKDHQAGEKRNDYYCPQHNELIEDDDLAIVNETITNEKDQGIPVRNLDSFSIYCQDSYSLRDFSKGISGCLASGLVTPFYDDDDDDEEEEDENDSDTSSNSAEHDSQFVRLSKLIEVWIDRKEYEDPKIWIRTKFAWYILRRPTIEYQDYFYSTCFSQIFTCMIVSKCHNDEFKSLDEFLAGIDRAHESVEAFAVSDAAAYAFSVLGRNLTSDDYEPAKAAVEENLSVFAFTHRRLTVRSLLLRDILGLSSTVSDSESSSSDPDTPPRRRKNMQVHRPVNSNPEKEVLQHRNTTVVTPHVLTIAKGLFYRTLFSTGQNVEDLNDDLNNFRDVCVSENPFVVHHDTPDAIRWGENFIGQDSYYKSVIIDDVVYHVGDTVAVEPGEDADQVNAANSTRPSARSRNTLGNAAWFCTIQYFYEEKRRKFFHGRWFEHGAKTILAETANPQGLFLTNECDDNLVSSILQKVEVRYLRPSEKEPVVIGEQDVGSSRFHYSHVWDRKTMSFTDPDGEAHELSSTAFLEKHKRCYSCSLQYLEEFRSNCVKSPTNLTIFGREYHCFDFVYVKQQSERDILSIAQIIDLLPHDGTDELSVRFFSRYEDEEWERSDELTERRAIQRTDRESRIHAEDLDGHCFVEAESLVRDLQMWVTKDDHFYVRDAGEKQSKIVYCDMCRSAMEEHDRIESTIKLKHKLRALDLFSGAGGLTTGMDESGFVETQWAVEFSQSASRTLKHNHPEVQVYNQDCNLLLKHAIETYEGKKPQALRSLDDNRPLPPMPLPGEVDLIMGGPPCQSFSGMNMHKKADDIRHTLVCNMISYVEHYRPLYFMIENVTGLLYCSLKGKQQGKRIVGGIEAGIVKFIMRSLTSLGYQVQIRVLNSAEYGSPQARKRVIFWAAALGIPLPKYPTPSHICQQNTAGGDTRKVSSIGRIPVASRSRDPEHREVHDYAPFWAVTVRDAIHDLPGYDWKDPHKIVPRTAEHKEEEALRLKVFPSFIGHTKAGPSAVVGFVNLEPYRHKPRHPYQAWCRRSNGDMVKDQYSACFPTDVVERTVNVPFKPFAGHANLPRKYRKVNRLDGEGFEKAKSTYRRLDSHGQFRTAMTVVRPNAKGSTVLHPTQKRVITIRECARAQGFPDKYDFLSVNKTELRIVEDKYRQIGNAVPVHLALALGKALGETMISHWKGDASDETLEYSDDERVHWDRNRERSREL